MLGVLGGTFDPVHHGHLRLAIEMAESLGLAEVRLVPLHTPPHREPPRAPAALRLAMLTAAVAGTPYLKVDDRELRRAGPSYTVDTLEELRREAPARPLCLILGMDAFRGMQGWHRWQAITGLTHLAVARRPGSAPMPSGAIGTLVEQHGVSAPEDLKRHRSGRVFILDIPALDISASAIRARIEAGLSPRHLLPDAVLEIIEAHGLYRE